MAEDSRALGQGGRNGSSKLGLCVAKGIGFHQGRGGCELLSWQGRAFEITPFAPNELVESYVSEFGSKYPFGEVLARIARISRGIFRRFLRYLAVCIELHRLTGKQEEALSPTKVDEVLNREMEKDWEADLRQIFPRGDAQRKALKILNILIRTDEYFAPQEGFPDMVYGLGQAETSTIMSKLEEHGYIKRVWINRKRHVRLNI